MNKQTEGALYTHMASQYVEQYGQELQRELAALETANVQNVTPGLDARVWGQINANKRRRGYRRGAGVLAACLLLALGIPLAMRFMHVDSISLPNEAEAGTTTENTGDATEDTGDTAEYPGGNTAESGIISLRFDLPANLSVADVQLDNGKSVYYLEDVRMDDVVMTLERNAAGSDQYPGFSEITVNGSPALVRAGGDYSLLTFEKSGVRYELTCRYDVNTLIDLSGHIL